VAIGAPQGQIHLHAAATGKLLRTLTSPAGAGDIFDLAFSPDGRHLAIGSTDGQVRIWDLAGDRLAAQWSAGQGNVRALAFSPSGQLLATVGNDLHLWRVPDHVLLLNYQTPIQTYFAVGFTGEGRYLALGSSAGQGFLFDMKKLHERLETLHLGW
jgi:WD40 repeat protein